MGITNYHNWLQQKFPTCFISIKSNNIYEYIYIDTNFILHNCMYNCTTENEFLFKITSRLDFIFTNFIALKGIFISLDGPAPFSKIVLQRKRRTLAATLETEMIEENELNPLWLTPGTKAMERITKHLQDYVEILKSGYKFIKPDIIVASSNEPEEGEIKICKKVIENGKKNLLDRHLIIGNDSDLVVLSMAMKPIYYINIMFTSKNGNEIVSLEKLLHLHCRKINRDNKIENLIGSNLRDDFVIVSLLMGNDYLPKLGFINYEKIWAVYYGLLNKLSNDETITKTIKNDKDCTETTILDKTIFSRFMYNLYMNMPKSYKTINIKTYNKKRTVSYLKGLLWCIKMYKQGFCPDYNYIYDHEVVNPFELLFYMADSTSKDIIITNNISNTFISVEAYPLCVMPKFAMSLVDVKYHSLINGKLAYLYIMESCKICNKYKKDIADLKSKKNSVIKIQKNYNKHKESHHDFCINDIYKIISLI